MTADEEKLVRRRPHTRPPSRARTLWDNYKVELIVLLAAGFGLFLLVEQLNIRKSLAAWIRAVVAGLFSRFRNLDGEIQAFLARVSLSDLIGVLLVVAAVAAFLLRLRWRLLHAPTLTSGNCPKCDGAIHRIHRTWYDRLIGLYVPVRRYRCADPKCGWKGLRVGRHHASVRRRSSPSKT